MRMPCRSCTPKQIDLQENKSAAAQYKRRYYLAPPQSILTKQI